MKIMSSNYLGKLRWKFINPGLQQWGHIQDSQLPIILLLPT